MVKIKYIFNASVKFESSLIIKALSITRHLAPSGKSNTIFIFYQKKKQKKIPYSFWQVFQQKTGWSSRRWRHMTSHTSGARGCQLCTARWPCCSGGFMFLRVSLFFFFFIRICCAENFWYCVISMPFEFLKFWGLLLELTNSIEVKLPFLP